MAPVLAARNRYLVTSSGRFVGARTLPLLVMLSGFVGAPAFAVVGSTVGIALELTVITVISVVIGIGGFFATVIALWVFLLTGQRDIARAAQMWLAGDTAGPIPLCQKPLGRVFRSDVRMRALYTLGLCAEANGDFSEAEDLFRRAYDAVPAMAASKWKRRGQCMMLAHRAIALVATGRVAEADGMVRQASALAAAGSSTEARCAVQGLQRPSTVPSPPGLTASSPFQRRPPYNGNTVA